MWVASPYDPKFAMMRWAIFPVLLVCAAASSTPALGLDLPREVRALLLFSAAEVQLIVLLQLIMDVNKDRQA